MTKHSKGGRPTKYAPDMGEKIMAIMRRGISLTAAAASLGVHRDTVYSWAEAHPAFAEELKLARGLRLYRLETDLLEAPNGPFVTSRIFALKCADRVEWQDRQDLVHSIAPDDPFALFLRSINGRVLRPIEPPASEGEAIEGKIIEHDAEPKPFEARVLLPGGYQTEHDDKPVTRKDKK